MFLLGRKKLNKDNHPHQLSLHISLLEDLLFHLIHLQVVLSRGSLQDLIDKMNNKKRKKSKRKRERKKKRNNYFNNNES